MSQPSFFIAEDHSLTNLGVREFLSSKGFICHGNAKAKSETFEKLSELAESGQLPEILILDLFLNGESGLELIKEISKRYPEIKIIVYSMYENAGIVALALEYGAKGYVCKSSEEKELFTAIKRVSEGESYIQSALVQPLIVYHSLLESFTKKEAAVIKKAVESKPNELIAKELSISVRTVENYLSRIYEKTGCQSRSDLAKKFGGGGVRLNSKLNAAGSRS